jgi:hypothetical protein
MDESEYIERGNTIESQDDADDGLDVQVTSGVQFWLLQNGRNRVLQHGWYCLGFIEIPFAPPYHFFGAMVFYARYRTTHRMKHLKMARKHFTTLKRFEAAGSPNVSAFVLALEAEALSLISRDVTAIVSAYNKAINALKADNLYHREALAHERLGFVLHSLGCHDLSNTHLDRALSLYAEWGANAKYEWILAQRSLQCNNTSTDV